MNLHRASKQADWESVVVSKRNVFQKIAAATHGVISPANAITVIGLGIVVGGLAVLIEGNYWTGLLLVAVGRLLDIADGLVAEATKTKSPLGELFDAAADKIGTFITIAALFIMDITSWWIIAALILPQAVIVAVVWYKKWQDIGIHPTRQGKVSMALVWLGIVALVVSKALGEYQPLLISAYFVIICSFILGLYAVWQYATGRDQD